MGPDSDSPPKANLENYPGTSPQRVTPQEVEKARAEKRAAMTKLLDDMEASVDSQGQYFAKIGQKRPITEVRQVTTSKFMGLGSKTTDQEEVTGYEDNRAFILKAPLKHIYRSAEYQIFLIVTPDGIYSTEIYYTSEINPPDQRQTDSGRKRKQEYDILMALSRGDQTTDDWQYTEETTYRGLTPTIKTPNFMLFLTTPDQTTLDKDFQQAITESISMTESPYKKQVAEAKQQTQVATGAADMIRSLPPRE